MPKYDYHCPANGQTVEARHSMSDKLTTWAELCELAGVDPGATPADSPIERLVSFGQPMTSGKSEPEPPAGCCGGGMCGMG